MPYCHLDFSSIPATCSEDVCQGKSQTDCNANPACTFTTTCGYKELCDRQTQATCSSELGCEFNAATQTCGKMILCDTYNNAAGSLCTDSTCPLMCASDPQCVLVQNETSASCSKKPCTD